MSRLRATGCADFCRVCLSKVLDFSQDERTVFTLSAGEELCELTAQTSTSPARVLPAPDSSGPGECVVTVTFPPFNNASLTADTSITVVTMIRADLLLLHYDVTAISSFAPDFSPDSRSPQLRFAPADTQPRSRRVIGINVVTCRVFPMELLCPPICKLYRKPINAYNV
jgi:hypothetical protein